jgi:hypothetical protein
MHKYFFKYILILTIITSCSEDKIQLSAISLDSSGNFYKTPEDMEKAVVAVYDGLQSLGQYGQYFVYLMEVRSDNSRQQSVTNSGGSFGDIDLFIEEAINPIIDLVWQDCYQGIQRCNIVLNRIDAVDNNPNKNIQKGEAKFIRALTYFNLVRLFGDVPLVTIEYDDPFEAFTLARTPKGEVYDQIILDLTDAVALLGNNSIRPGGATKNSANALLGKVYLTLGNIPEAISALRNVSGSLLPNYSDNFGIANENSEESLFEVQFTKGGIGEGSPYANLFAPFGATELIGGVGTTAGDNLPTEDLYNSYDIDDLRRDVTLGIASTNVLYTKKYLDTPTLNRDGENNFIVLRYADVVLMLAEALNEQSYVPDGEAFDLINSIRFRADVQDLTSITIPNQEAFRNAMLNERRWELAFENHRWFDLVRSGRAVDIMNDHTSVTGPLATVDANKLVYPIPQSQIDATNNVITQNTGY